MGLVEFATDDTEKYGLVGMKEFHDAGMDFGGEVEECELCCLKTVSEFWVQSDRGSD